MGVPHPIPYQGSKRALAATIISYLPDRTCRLIEPFAGSAAISLAAVCRDKATEVVLNDANVPLVDLWEQIIHHPQQISEQYHRLWEEQQGREREYYDHTRARFNETHRPEFLLYLLARCVKASVRYNAQGEFNQSPDNRRCGAHPSTMQQQIMGASSLLRHKTLLMRGDYRAVLGEAGREDIVYMDPPYQGVCGRRNPRYSTYLDYEPFVRSLESLNQRGIRYLISYDGRTGAKTFGEPLPECLHLKRLEIHAGRSSQATLLNRIDDTYESLYLSPALVESMSSVPDRNMRKHTVQHSLFTSL